MRRMAERPTALRALFNAIASRDRSTAARLLQDAPELARLPAGTGATRTEAVSYFVDEIAHYIYAGDTALHIAAAAYAVEIVEDLLARGAEVRARNRRGAEPLHYAADGSPGSRSWAPDRQFAVIALLIRSGADPNAEDKSGVAPLHRAVRTRSSGAVRALLSAGADLRQRNKSGSTALHLAVQNTGRSGSGSPRAHEEQRRIIRLLLDHGALPSDRDAKGKSVAECAASGWLEELIRGA